MDRCALMALSVLGLVLLLSWFPVGLSAPSENGTTPISSEASNQNLKVVSATPSEEAAKAPRGKPPSVSIKTTGATPVSSEASNQNLNVVSATPSEEAAKAPSVSIKTGINIRIEAGATLEESRITATGRQVNIIADSERASFGIGSDADLKRVVGNYFGRQPDEAYLRGPTPSNNTYSRNGWEEVKRVLVPTKAEILNVVSNPTIMARKILKNNSDKKATFSTKFSKQVSNSVSNEWSNSETISVGESIGIDLIFASSETTIGLDLSFGQSNTESQETTLGTESGVTVELKPGESAIADLSASSGKMNVRITYEAYLTGSTALHYNDKYNDRLDWQLDIQDVLRGSNKVEIIENIEMDYYSNVATNLG